MAEPKFKEAMPPSEELGEERKKSLPKTPEISARAAGEIGEYEPLDFFKKELRDLSEQYTKVRGPGVSAEEYDRRMQEHKRKRLRLQEIIQGISRGDKNTADKAHDYILEQITDRELSLEPLVLREKELNRTIDKMKKEELAGEAKYGYGKYRSRNEEIDEYRRKNEELRFRRNLSDPALKIKFAELEGKIKSLENLRDFETEFGKTAKDLRSIQGIIERINKERRKLEELRQKLAEMKE